MVVSEDGLPGVSFFGLGLFFGLEVAVFLGVEGGVSRVVVDSSGIILLLLLY